MMRSEGTPMENRRVILSVVENRAREVCVCILDTSETANLEVFFFSDSYSYNETVLLLEDISPTTILINEGCRNRVLTKKIQSLSQASSEVLLTNRQYFDQNKGAEILKRLLIRNTNAAILSNYSFLSGCHCLLKYVENLSGRLFAPNSLRLKFETKGRMFIDRATAQHLELVRNLRSGTGNNSLFEIINYTKTKVGAKLLKANILQPLTDLTSITARFEMIELLLRNGPVFAEVTDTLRSFPDLDKLLSQLCTTPKTITAQTIRGEIDALMTLRDTIRLCFKLSESFQSIDLMDEEEREGSDSPLHRYQLMIAMVKNLSENTLHNMERAINHLLEDDKALINGKCVSKHQECFVIRNGVDAVLDLSRENYTSFTENVYTLANQLTEEDNLPIKVGYSATRGYYFSLPLEFDYLPIHYIQPVIQRNRLVCTTASLNSLQTQIESCVNHMLRITGDLIQSVLEDVRSDIEYIFSLVDSVALLDMLTSFADLIALSTDTFSRPVLLEGEGPLRIHAGRHPIVSVCRSANLGLPFIPNDTDLRENEQFLLITGINGSGKTVYMKQIAIIIIMAQMGCFVPANDAVIPIRERILSRVGGNDDVENNTSTFSAEMKELGFVLRHTSPTTLILIDELGRSSSLVDGLSISLAVCEYLLKAHPIVLYATHNIPPKLLTQAYRNAVSVNFEAAIQYGDRGSSEEGVKIKYMHCLSMDPASTLQQDYGILVSEVFGFPPFTIEAAKKFKNVLKRESNLNYRLTYSADSLEEDVKDIKGIFRSYEGNMNAAIPALKERLRQLNKAKLEKFYYYLSEADHK